VTADTSFKLPGALDTAVRAEVEAWRAGDKVRRLWARDTSLWTGADEAAWLVQALRERGRRVLRVHLGSDVKAGLALLRRAVEASR
jgi:hypothetical protein